MDNRTSNDIVATCRGLFLLGIVIVAIIAAVFAARPASANKLTLQFDEADTPYRPNALQAMGGDVKLFANRINKLNRQGRRVQIDIYACASACTYFLLADRVCVGSRTVFQFHGPQHLAVALLSIPGPTNWQAAEIMARDYNSRWPGLGDWFLERAAHKTGTQFTNVTGRALHDAFGMELCDD